MALFGDKKNKTPKAGVKEPKPKKKKKGKEEDTTPLNDNPAFQVYDPGSSFNAQSGFIVKEQPSLIDEPPVSNPIAEQMAQATPIDFEQVQQAVNYDANAAAQQEAALNAAVQATEAAQAVNIDPTTGQPIQIDPTTGQPVQIDPNAVQQQVAFDPTTGQALQPAVDPVLAQQQVGIDPVTGQPLQAAYDPMGQQQVDYNNTLPNQQNTDVSLPAEATVVTDKHGRVARPVKRYRYTIINSLGKKESGPFEAETEEEVRNFLLSQDYQVLEVKERSSSDIDIGGNGKIGSADLSFSLTQLSTYLRAGIPLSDSVKILAKQATKSTLKHHFNQLVYQLLKGENLSDAMEMQGKVFPKLLINMVKTAEMTGDLPSILDDMAEYYTSMDQTKKQMKSAMTYPAVVLTIAVGVLVFMLTYLVPQFTSMFEEQGAELPLLTRAIVGVSNFIKLKWYLIIAGIALVIALFFLAYKKSKGFRITVQVILMHFPVVKNVIIYNEMANFSKTFASLLNHSVFITDSMEILSKITNNEIYKGIINKTLENLAKGDSISSAFRGEWAIPVVAYEMIVTGESTGQLGAMMEKVANHFQMLHKNVIDQMKSLVEPLMICFLAGIVGVILVSIIQPMFSIYSQIK